MHEFKPIRYESKPEFYRELRQELSGLYVDHWYSNLANASAALMAHVPRVNWVGFYLLQDGELRLGPFQGLPACLSIPLGRGVCGTAAGLRQTQRVADVHAFAGHIACDARSRSELVVPLLSQGEVKGVLDLDSIEVGRFDPEDQIGLEAIARELVERTRWPKQF